VRIILLSFLVIAATGCGLLEQEQEPVVETSAETSAITGLCGQARTTIGPILTTGELVAIRSGTDLYAAWTGTVSQPARIVKLDSQFRVLATMDSGVSGPNLSGLVELEAHVLAAYGTNAFSVVDMQQFTSDLGIWNYQATYASRPARSPFLLSPTNGARGYLEAFGRTLGVGTMDSSLGLIGGASFFDMTGVITQLAGDNGPRDSAAVWVEDLGGGVSRCSAGNIGFDNPFLPSLRATRVVSSDCRHARIAAGPIDDIQLVVLTTASGAVQAHLRRGGADIVNVLSTSGRAPKVRFDGTRFWIAWRNTGSSHLHIASIDPIGTLVRWSTSGPAVAGDEAFDLVRTSTTTTVLVAITPNALDFVTLCR
jgi:hypothetical protein